MKKYLRYFSMYSYLYTNDYFPSYSSTSTQKVLLLEYEYTSTITPSLQYTLS